MNRKSILFFMIMMTLVMAGCGGGGNEAGGGETEAVTLKLGHVGPAEADHPWEKYALEFGKQVEEQTNGEVKIDTYPSSQLGADRVMAESIQQGTLEMGLISTIAMGNFVPELQVWDLPYIFPADNAKVDEILNGPVGEQLAEAALEKRLVILAYWENDWRAMTNSTRPINTQDDLKGLKMRVVENQPSLDWFGRIGATPTPMAFNELYTGLQQGTVDGQDNGPILSYGSKLHETQKYFTATNHMYAPLAMVMSVQAWEGLSEESQKAMKDLAVSIGNEQRKYNREVAKEYTQLIKDSGVEVVEELTPEGYESFQQSAQETYEKLAPVVGQDLINQMLEYKEAE
ncbi:TRAP transporter substrate-binding protein [Planococcus sp. 1R117A]|uniref:TRAP transporter substrate-binding protein n=1 Tax=Planococcus sp. 1R117A TaxID=3447020 RepID=UPI003EDBC34A